MRGENKRKSLQFYFQSVDTDIVCEFPNLLNLTKGSKKLYNILINTEGGYWLQSTLSNKMYEATKDLEPEHLS